MTSNSSHARPGNFISAARRSRRFGSKASTRQQSTVSPTRRLSGSARPRRSPTPPTSKSRVPRRRQSQFAQYHPVLPPMRRTGAKASAADAATVTVRESTSRGPNWTPNQLGAGPEEDNASDQRVCATSWSSLRRASAIACRTPTGQIGNSTRAAGSRTTVEWRMLSISLLPMRAKTGVTKPSHKLEILGVRTGTGISQRFKPRCRAYSFIRSA